MIDKIKTGDIVCFCSEYKIKIGRVTKATVGCGEYTIVPFKGTRPIKRKPKDLITFSRLKRITENSDFFK